MTTAVSHIKYFLCLCFLTANVPAIGQEDLALPKPLKQDFAFVAGGNVGSAVPFPFYNIPDERHADMRVRPYIGFQYHREINSRLVLRIGHAFSQKAVNFNATLVDQPYNGYVEYDIQGQIAKGEIEDAYFNGYSEGSFNLRYYELNAALGYRLGKRASVYGGLYAAYLFKSENKVYVDGAVSLGPGLEPITATFQRSQDYSNMIRKWDFGFQLGFERQLIRKLSFNAFFSSSLQSLYKPELDAVSYTMLNMYACIGVSYHLFEGLYPQE